MTTLNISKADLDNYLRVIAEDYLGRRSGNAIDSVVQEMNEQFLKGLRYEIGNKYIKVIIGNSVHSFIVNTDTDKKFVKGAVLKAASWSAPARNFVRFNIEDHSAVEGGTRWTGVVY